MAEKWNEEQKKIFKLMKGLPHEETHQILHKMFDELLACYLDSTKKGISDSTVFELMEWSFKQTGWTK